MKTSKELEGPVEDAQKWARSLRTALSAGLDREADQAARIAALVRASDQALKALRDIAKVAARLKDYPTYYANKANVDELAGTLRGVLMHCRIGHDALAQDGRVEEVKQRLGLVETVVEEGP